MATRGNERLAEGHDLNIWIDPLIVVKHHFWYTCIIVFISRIVWCIVCHPYVSTLTCKRYIPATIFDFNDPGTVAFWASTKMIWDHLWLVTCSVVMLLYRSCATGCETRGKEDRDYVWRLVKIGWRWNVTSDWCSRTCRREWNWNHQVGHQYTTYDVFITF